MKPLNKVTFHLERFALPSPGQQLLDRFLIGYNHDATFHSPGCAVELVSTGAAHPGLEARAQQFGLRVLTAGNQTMHAAENAIVVAPAQIVREVLNILPNGSRCFVYGQLASNEAFASELVSSANNKEIALRTGTAAAAAFQLPPIEIPSRVRKALAVTYGPVMESELEALDALWNLIPPPEAEPEVTLLTGEKVWEAAYSPEWRDLFAATFSRSNTIQGDPMRDGRTQDVVGLKLVEKLVSEPRAWILDAGGTQTAIFVMNGALEDLNIAFKSSSGDVVSTQLYRPPPPMQDHFSNLAASIEDFFRRDTPPKSSGVMTLIPAISEQMRGRLLRRPAVAR